MTKQMFNGIEHELKLLKEVDDCFGYDFENGKGVFVQVVDYGEGMEYLIERNYVDEENVFEPYGDCNAWCVFGQLDECMRIIVEEIYNE